MKITATRGPVTWRLEVSPALRWEPPLCCGPCGSEQNLGEKGRLSSTLASSHSFQIAPYSQSLAAACAGCVPTIYWKVCVRGTASSALH